MVLINNTHQSKWLTAYMSLVPAYPTDYYFMEEFTEILLGERDYIPESYPGEKYNFLEESCLCATISKENERAFAALVCHLCDILPRCAPLGFYDLHHNLNEIITILAKVFDSIDEQEASDQVNSLLIELNIKREES